MNKENELNAAVALINALESFGNEHVYVEDMRNVQINGWFDIRSLAKRLEWFGARIVVDNKTLLNSDGLVD